jgi:hypothetical protein
MLKLLVSVLMAAGRSGQRMVVALMQRGTTLETAARFMNHGASGNLFIK